MKSHFSDSCNRGNLPDPFQKASTRHRTSTNYLFIDRLQAYPDSREIDGLVSLATFLSLQGRRPEGRNLGMTQFLTVYTDKKGGQASSRSSIIPVDYVPYRQTDTPCPPTKLWGCGKPSVRYYLTWRKPIMYQEVSSLRCFLRERDQIRKGGKQFDKLLAMDIDGDGNDGCSDISSRPVQYCISELLLHLFVYGERSVRQVQRDH